MDCTVHTFVFILENNGPSLMDVVQVDQTYIRNALRKQRSRKYSYGYLTYSVSDEGYFVAVHRVLRDTTRNESSKSSSCAL